MSDSEESDECSRYKTEIERAVARSHLEKRREYMQYTTDNRPFNRLLPYVSISSTSPRGTPEDDVIEMSCSEDDDDVQFVAEYKLNASQKTVDFQKEGTSAATEAECQVPMVKETKLLQSNSLVCFNLKWKVFTQHLSTYEHTKLDFIEAFYRRVLKLPNQKFIFFCNNELINLNNSSYADLKFTDKTVIDAYMLPSSIQFKAALPGRAEAAVQDCAAVVLHDCDEDDQAASPGHTGKTVQFTIEIDASENCSLQISLLPTEKLETLILKVSEVVEKPVASIKLLLNGCPLNPNDTVESLELRGDECFHLIYI